MGDKVGYVFAVLDVAFGRDHHSIKDLKSASRVTLEKLGLTTTDTDNHNDEAVLTLDKSGRSLSAGLSQYLALAIQIGNLLRFLPKWRIQTCAETASLVDSVVAATWLSLLKGLLMSA